jgi:hypothetical protein
MARSKSAKLPSICLIIRPPGSWYRSLRSTIGSRLGRHRVYSEWEGVIDPQNHSKVLARFLRAGDRRIDPALVLRRPDFGRSRTIAEQCAAAPMERALDKVKSPHEHTRNERGRDDVELIPEPFASLSIWLGRRGRLFQGKQRRDELLLSPSSRGKLKWRAAVASNLSWTSHSRRFHSC